MSAQSVLPFSMKGDSFFSSINGLAQILKGVNELKQTSGCVLDFTNLNKVRPAFILPLAGLLEYWNRQNRNISFNKPTFGPLREYLQSIYFPDGVGDNSEGWQTAVDWEHYANGTYIPITHFNTHQEIKRISETDKLQKEWGNFEELVANAFANREPRGFVQSPESAEYLQEKISGTFQSILHTHFQAKGELKNAVSYLLAEAFDNIEQHSKAPQGWVQAQAYPKLGHIDLCIVDFGATLLGPYQASGFDEVLTDTDAMRKALNGQSVKEKDGGRGYGIRTSRRMLCEGLSGQHVLWSGRCIAYWEIGNKLIEVPDALRFPGTMIAMRIPTEKYLRIFHFTIG